MGSWPAWPAPGALFLRSLATWNCFLRHRPLLPLLKLGVLEAEGTWGSFSSSCEPGTCQSRPSQEREAWGLNSWQPCSSVFQVKRFRALWAPLFSWQPKPAVLLNPPPPSPSPKHTAPPPPHPDRSSSPPLPVPLHPSPGCGHCPSFMSPTKLFHLASLLSLEHTNLIPAPGPLYWLFPLPGKLLPQISAWPPLHFP